MALIKMINYCRILGRNKLMHIFSFWFEEDIIYFYNNYIFSKNGQKKKTLDTSKEMY